MKLAAATNNQTTNATANEITKTCNAIITALTIAPKVSTATTAQMR